MSRLTIMLIPERSNATKQVTLPQWLIRILSVASLLLSLAMGYFVFDYIELRFIRAAYHKLASENEGLKGEARVLMTNLEEVKTSLRQVQDYTSKLTEITDVKMKKVSKKTGIKSAIGPLSQEEFNVATSFQLQGEKLPLGVSMDKLIFRPVFDQLFGIGESARNNAMQLQHILSNLSKQKSLLSSIPSITPVNGWVTSGFGTRISPFTGQKTPHKGIDIASPIGTPVHAPADGVVIFTGKKAGFGNFIMIAHGYGIVSRFGHNAQNMVQPGQRVKRGEQIATVGMSGRTTGPHLHYEVVVNNRYQNPKKFILSTADQALTH